MKKKMHLSSIYVILILTSTTYCWHDFSNTDYHCWPLSANADNQVPYNPCKGVNIKWIESPPDEVTAGVDFNVSVEMTLTSEFYTWSLQFNLFDGTNGSAGVSDAAGAQLWCENTVCPQASLASIDNCCVHHFNIHTCPLSGTGVENNLCGPWIPPQGQVFTHSAAIVGPVTQGNWTSTVEGLYVDGVTSLIAHYKIAGMSLALEKTIKVLPKADCGNGNCEADDGEDCSVCPKDCGTCPLKTWQIALIGSISVLLVLIAAGFCAVLQYQKRKLLWDEKWIYSYQTIRIDDEAHIFMGSVISRKSNGGITDCMSITGSFMTSGGHVQIFTKTGIVDGKRLAVKHINKEHFSLSRHLREEVRTVREMDHPNICRFFGGCIEIPNVCILMEYCAKGSLADVLLADEIPLSWSFRFSFANDIARGMSYLHSHKITHSHLKSSNCVIDDRWSVKITDYGLHLFRKNDFTDENVDKDALARRNCIYQAPEYYSNQKLTDKIDVYAYAIILVEIGTRNDPYGDEDISTITPGWKPALPKLNKCQNPDDRCPCPENFCKLISLCWDTNPIERPSFEMIKKIIHKINPNRQNPVDLMMNMMEKYSKHLESIVGERTRELIVEKQKTDRLLYTMLPKEVADVLRQGAPVQAQSFEVCTIYFSDIVGFTTICAGSTALEVVNLLNRLYITFDEIIEKYDIYKVETIGDAYMVVAGVPKQTKFHASEIACMALDLVAECKRFVIPHRTTDKLRIRVGIHSGPVCAGVVGLKMPRYCLFGDTVNTASRMESNGEAYRIHMSDTTYSELESLGGFDVENRGAISVKGKGEMTTYWLLGKTNSKSNKVTSQQEAGNDKTPNGILQYKNMLNHSSFVHLRSDSVQNGKIENLEIL